jgi:hypothetical protein
MPIRLSFIGVNHSNHRGNKETSDFKDPNWDM